MLVILVLGLLYMYILPYRIGQVEIWRGGGAVSRESLCCITRVVTSNQQCLPRLKAPAHVLSSLLHQSCRQLAQGSIFEFYTGLWATIAPTVNIVTERTKPSSPLKVANFTGGSSSCSSPLSAVKTDPRLLSLSLLFSALAGAV